MIVLNLHERAAFAASFFTGIDMTREEQQKVWAIALEEFGAQAMEQKVLGSLLALLDTTLMRFFPYQVNAEEAAHLVGLLIANAEAGQHPLLGTLRTMNHGHFRVLQRLWRQLTLSLLADIPTYLVPSGLLRLKAYLNFGV